MKKRAMPLAVAAWLFLAWGRVVVDARRTRLTWVNGIAHSVEHMEEGRVFISERFGGKRVVYCHNPTSMKHDDDFLGYFTDLGQAGTQKLGYITAEVNTLVDHLRSAIKAVGRRGRVIHIAHSQGALITSLAAKQLTPMEMSQMEVIAFGGAAALTKTPQTPFARCINYYSVNDPLLLVVPAAAAALRSGLASEEYCFLAPRLGDPIADHNLFAPTYGDALEWEGSRFLRLYESPVVRLAKRLWLFLCVLFSALDAQLRAVLKTLLRPLLLWCIVVYLWTASTANQLARLWQTKLVRPAAVESALLWESVHPTPKDKYIPVSEILETTSGNT